MFGKKLEYTIILDRKLANNNQGQSRHWSSSHKERQAWATAVRDGWIKDWQGVEWHPEDFWECGPDPDKRIGLVVTRHLGKRERLWDSDSVLRGNAKQCIDALISAGLATDDSPLFIDWTIGMQDDSNREAGPFTTVEVYS